MQYIILLNHNENLKQIEIEEQNKFVYSILEALEIPLDGLNFDEPFSVEDKIKLRAILDKYNVSIISNIDGELKIYLNSDLIGQWNKPLYKIKQDHTKLDIKKRLYLEMINTFYSIFDEEYENYEKQ